MGSDQAQGNFRAFLGNPRAAASLVKQGEKKKEIDMTMMQKGAFALALLGGVAFAPIVQAVEGDVDIDRDSDVIVEEDRPGLLPGEPLDRDADVHVEADEPDAYIEEDDDDDVGASVEVDPD
jgi:hypothetical protein